MNPASDKLQRFWGMYRPNFGKPPFNMNDPLEANQWLQLANRIPPHKLEEVFAQVKSIRGNARWKADISDFDKALGLVLGDSKSRYRPTGCEFCDYTGLIRVACYRDESTGGTLRLGFGFDCNSCMVHCECPLGKNRGVMPHGRGPACRAFKSAIVNEISLLELKPRPDYETYLDRKIREAREEHGFRLQITRRMPVAERSRPRGVEPARVGEIVAGRAGSAPTRRPDGGADTNNPLPW